MKRFLILFLILIPVFSIAEVTVKLGDRFLSFDSKTNCAEGVWGKTPENTCRCCVLKEALKNGTFVGTGRCLTDCKKSCTPDVIKNLRHEYERENIYLNDSDDEEGENSKTETYKVSALDDVGLEQSIIRDAQVVKMLPVNPETENTALTTEGIKHVLREVLARHKTPEQINSMKEKVLGGGAQTEQLVGVFEGKKLAYIVKVLKKDGELHNLNLLKQDFGEYNLLNEHRRMEFPAIAMPIGEVQYKVKGRFGKPTTRSVIVMPAAPGSSMFDIIKRFVEDVYNPHLQKEKSEAIYQAHVRKIERTLSILGERLGRFHLAGMENKKGELEDFALKEGHLNGFSRNVHGDFHANNVFFHGVSEADAIVTFIDPETLVQSYKHPRDVASDLRHFYFFLTAHVKTSQNVAYLVKDQKDWHSLIIEPFLRGYIKGYGVFSEDGSLNEKRLQDVMHILRRSLASVFGSKEDRIRAIMAIPFGFFTAQTKYIEPMLDQIEEDIKPQGPDDSYEWVSLES